MSFQFDQAPKETLYVSGLNDRIKLEDMKFILYILFSQYGEILQIVMKKTNKLRGQAFIVFQNLSNATNAKSALTGMSIFDHPLKVEFARQRSEIFDRMEGKIYYKKKQTKELKPNLPSPKNSGQQAAQQQFQQTETNNVLIIEEIPSFVTEQMLVELFHQFPGYSKLKLLENRGLAFVEFLDADRSTVALKGLNGFQITQEHALRIKYARTE
ncbi:hypothetical protein pb186bvf_014815 [Paramecium bursaria]